MSCDRAPLIPVSESSQRAFTQIYHTCYKIRLVKTRQFISFHFSVVSEPGVLQDVCPTESFAANCPDHSVVVMESAQYGRMRKDRCLTSNLGVGCSSNVRSYFDGQCSGRISCEVKVPNDDLYELNTCNRDLVPYLEATYTCLPGTYKWQFRKL